MYYSFPTTVANIMNNMTGLLRSRTMWFLRSLKVSWIANRDSSFFSVGVL